MDGWYYRVFGVEFGPVKMEKLIELAKSHSISRDDLVRFGLKSSWRKVGSIGQLMAHLPFEPNEKSLFANPNSYAKSNDLNGTPVDNSTANSIVADAQPQEPDRRWWCKIQDREYGPVPLSKVIEWASAGRLHRTDQIRFAQDPYVLAGEVQGLFPDLPKAPVSAAPSPTIHTPEAGPSQSVPAVNGSPANSGPPNPPSFPQQKAS